MVRTVRRHRQERIGLVALVVLLALGSIAMAERPRVAVLGLEVVGEIDQQVTVVAQELTRGLRARPRSGSGPYLLAANSERELIDEKMLKACDDEAPKCMNEIGKGLATDVLIYGNVKLAGAAYAVTLQVLDTRKKGKPRTLEVSVPGTSSAEAIRAAGKEAYRTLTGDVSKAAGTLIVTANVEKGTVFVDDSAKGTLSGGSARLRVPEGRHRVAVEAPGHVRKETAVKVEDDDTVTQAFELEERTGANDHHAGRRSGVWKPAFFLTAIGGVALGVFSTYAFLDSRSEATLARGTLNGCVGDWPACAPTNDDCGNDSAITFESPEAQGHFHNACDRYHQHLYTAIAGGVLGVGALVTGYMAYVRRVPESHGRTALRASSPGGVAVAPIVGPDGAGASVRVTW